MRDEFHHFCDLIDVLYDPLMTLVAVEILLSSTLTP
mgnify:CR=1 FL=1